MPQHKIFHDVEIIYHTWENFGVENVGEVHVTE